MIKASVFLACIYVLSCVLSASAASFEIGAKAAETEIEDNNNGTQRVKRAGCKHELLV
jgi:hypothetical protein